MAAAWVAQFLCIVGFAAAGPFFPFYIRDLGVTDLHQVALWAGILASAGAVSMALMSPIWGVLADRRGRKLMVQRATFGGAVVLGAMAFATSVQQLFALRVLQGMLTGTVSAFMALIATIAPPSEVGFSLGLMQMAVYAGASAGPLIGGLVADQLGYRWVFGFTAILILVGGVLALLLVREEFVRPQGKRSNELLAGARAITHTATVLGAIGVIAFISLGNAVPNPILPLLVETLQADPARVNTATGLVYGAGAVASALAAVVIGRLADRRSPRGIMLVCGAGSALAYVGQAVSPAYVALIAASFFMGLFNGGLLITANATVARYAPKDQQGAIYGMSNSVGSAGAALGPMLGAAVATAWGLRAAFWVSAVILALVAVWTAVIIKPKPPSPPPAP